MFSLCYKNKVVIGSSRAEVVSLEGTSQRFRLVPELLIVFY